MDRMQWQGRGAGAVLTPGSSGKGSSSVLSPSQDRQEHNMKVTKPHESLWRCALSSTTVPLVSVSEKEKRNYFSK